MQDYKDLNLNMKLKAIRSFTTEKGEAISKLDTYTVVAYNDGNTWFKIKSELGNEIVLNNLHDFVQIETPVVAQTSIPSLKQSRYAIAINYTSVSPNHHFSTIKIDIFTATTIEEAIGKAVLKFSDSSMQMGAFKAIKIPDERDE